MSKPSDRKREKKNVRKARSRAKVTARRARDARKRDAALARAADPRRNVHVERGRPVVVNDITPYARPRCGACKGKGIVGMRTAGDQTGAEPCRCAHKRFMKAHPEIIVEATGAAWWPAEEAPLPVPKSQLVDPQGNAIESAPSSPINPGANPACGCTAETVCAAHEKPNQSAAPCDAGFYPLEGAAKVSISE